MTTTFTPSRPYWCAGCGDYGVLQALENGLRQLGIPAHEALVVAGIGCSGSLQNNLSCYGYHTLHGRVLPSCTGAKLANPELTVIGVGGDGDGYAIGGGHFMHTLKRNPSITYIVMNNATYGLTKGQPSPTSLNGFENNVEEDLDPVLLGLSMPGSTFLARGYTGQPAQLTRLVVAALRHAEAGKGFAYLEVLSPCVTYNDTYREWRTAVFDVEQDPTYDPNDRAAVFARLLQCRAERRLPIGILFQNEHPALESVALRKGNGPAALVDIDPVLLEPRYEKLMQSLMR